MSDRMNRAGTRAKCAECGSWYGVNDVHVTTSPSHVAALVRRDLETLYTADQGGRRYTEVAKNLTLYAASEATNAMARMLGVGGGE